MSMSNVANASCHIHRIVYGIVLKDKKRKEFVL